MFGYRLYLERAVRLLNNIFFRRVDLLPVVMFYGKIGRLLEEMFFEKESTSLKFVFFWYIYMQ